MGKIVLLAVAAAWAAVLLPPLLRSRMENRPGSSVTDFRRQLSTLQRAVPTRSMTPMRAMGRPLTQSPLQRPAASGRPGQFQRSHTSPAGHGSDRVLDRGIDRVADHGYERSHGEVAYTGELQRRYDRSARDTSDLREQRGSREYRDQRDHGADRHAPARRVSQREVVRRRRTNVLFFLVMATGLTLFLAATTKSSAMVYAFAFAFVSLCGYCYKLAQLRQYESDRSGYDAHWSHAA
jgi:hypothetical protein